MRKTAYLYTFLTIISVLICHTTSADHYPRPHSTVSAGIDFERLSINPAIANRELIGETANAINLGFNLGEHDSKKPYMDFGIGLSLIYFDDRGQFTQETFDDFGHLINASSDAEALHGYIEGGPTIPLSPYVNAGFKAGYALPLSSDRSISSCSSCYSEDIDIDAGFYSEVGLSHKIGNYSLKSSYKYYADSNNGIEDSLSIGIHVRY